MSYVKVATCNLNQWAMDFEGNLERIKASIAEAKAADCTFRTGPELEITGYGCEDSFLEPDTFAHAWESLGQILASDLTDGILCDIGMPVLHRNVSYNCRVILLDRKVLGVRPKICLANDGNYREMRFFTPWYINPALAGLGEMQEYYLPRVIREITGQVKVPIGIFAIAAAVAALGARVTLVAGPVSLKTPAGVNRIDVESADDMFAAVKRALPADVAVMVAAVADWRPKEYQGAKIKKRGSAPPALMLAENPDILTNLAAGSNRPELVIGFAAETDNVIEYAKQKRKRKVADWIVANDVSGDVMGGDLNRVHIISADGVESLEEMPKSAVAMALAERIAATLKAEAAE